MRAARLSFPGVEIEEMIMIKARRGLNPHVWCCLVLIALAAALMGRYLVTGECVVSNPGGDGDTFFYSHYWLALSGLKHGEIISWNPYIFSGTPAVGTFQYSLLYPPCWLGIVLPLATAINWCVFLHVVLAGISMYAWTCWRGLRRTAALVAAMMFMLGGALFPHITTGHFPHLYAMAWIPLVFLGVDGWLRQRRARWLLLSAAAAAAQLYAGFPQYFYYTALGAGLYALLELPGCSRRWSLAAGLLAVYPFAALLAAAEWLPAFFVTAESVRQGGLSPEFAATASLQPKNLLLLLSPGFFGRLGDWSYWDTEHLHETWVYCGITGLWLAGLGWWRLARGPKVRIAILLMVILVLALGVNTPAWNPLREWLPMYASFRSSGRMLALFAVLVSLLAGMGMDGLVAGQKGPRGLIAAIAGTGGVLLLAGLLLYGNNLSGWYHDAARLATIVPHWKPNVDNAVARALAQRHSAGALCWSALWLGLLAATLWWTRRSERGAKVLPLLTAAELLCFASPLVGHFRASDSQYPALARFARERTTADERHLNLLNNKNASILFGRENLWGYEALVLMRYAHYIAASQGIPPHLANPDQPVYRNSPMFRLLRGRYAFVQTNEGIRVVELQKDVLPRFSVVGGWRVMTDRDAILRTLSAPDFDFRHEVILETAPGLPPVPAAGTVPAPAPEYKINVLSSSATRWEVEVETGAPGVLLMTDAYAKGWRARARPGSAQQTYDLQPADWAVRGIPLTAAGAHRIEITYTAPGFAAGLWITSLTLATLAALTLPAWRRRWHW
jgi:hypothetical protein